MEELAVPRVCSNKKLPAIFQPIPAGLEAELEKVLAVGRVSSDPANLCLPGSPRAWLGEKPSRFLLTPALMLVYVQLSCYLHECFILLFYC